LSIKSVTYSFSFEGQSGGGAFGVTPPSNPANHGHVHVDPDHPRYLVYDDGTPHYFYGSKWIDATNYGPTSKGGESNPYHRTDAQFLSYLDDLQSYGHNGILIVTALYPIENDKLSWDPTWIQRAEWLVREAGERGVYCHISFFNTWSRDKSTWFSYSTSGSKHPFNVWSAGDDDAKKTYIRNVIARFSGFSNVYWELGNEMEHSPNSGSAFKTQADTKYIPWIRQYDPYGLPIGLSEKDLAKGTDVDIIFAHSTNQLPEAGVNRPWLMNELVFGWDGGVLYSDDTIRNGSNRLGYRRTFWKMFVHGGVGSSQATHLKINSPLNQAVYNVMGDQQRLRDLLETLPVDINEMAPVGGFVVSGPGEHATRGVAGGCYVTYFLGSSGGGSVTVSLPGGDHIAAWYDPKTGTYTAVDAVLPGGGNAVVWQPAFIQDMVLRVCAEQIDPGLDQGCKDCLVGFDSCVAACQAEGFATGSCGNPGSTDPDNCCVCQLECTPNCAGKSCGGDGCGGSCGECSGGASCNGTNCVWSGSNCAPCPWGYSAKSECYGKFACNLQADTVGMYYYDGAWQHHNDCAICNMGGGLQWQIWQQ